MNYEELYYTDIAEHAAFLLAGKQVMDSFYWAKGACVFVFENGSQCEKIISGILKGEFHINALSLVEALKTINSIFNLRIVL